MNKTCIGTNKKEINTIFQQYGLMPLRKIVTSNDFEKAAKETIKGKSRKRVFTPEIVFWLISLVGITCDSMGVALEKAWEQIRPIDDEMPCLPASKAAFTKARKKLPVRFFQKVSDSVLEYFCKRYSSQGYWKGLKVKIVDGVTINLPESKELRKKFGANRNQHEKISSPVQANMVCLFWAFLGICDGFAIGSLRMSEKTGLLNLLELLKKGDLLLGDRYYPGYELFCAIIKRDIEFLFRLKKGIKPERLEKIGKRDWLVNYKVPKSKRNKFSEEITLRLISYDIRGFRTSYLLTTLVDSKKYSREEIIDLYVERWQIETRYNELKHMIKIEELRSRTKNGIMKEIITHITVANLVRIVMIEAAEKEGIKATDLSYKHALEKVKDTVVIMMQSPVYHLNLIYNRMIKEIGQMKILKRPGRRYPRQKKKLVNSSKVKLFVEVSYAKAA